MTVMVVEVKQVHTGLGKICLLMKSKEKYNSKPWQGRDAVHLYKSVNPSLRYFFCIHYLYHLPKGETSRVYTVAADLTEFEVLLTSVEQMCSELLSIFQSLFKS